MVRARLATGRVHGVVFQGMGEPLANLDAVLEAIAVLSEPCALGIDARAITVCTAGLPGGIRRLAAEAPNVRLGLSIASAIAGASPRGDADRACATTSTTCSPPPPTTRAPPGSRRCGR